MNEQARAALAFLSEHHVLSLALVAEDGVPHACSLMYAHHGFTLYWVSDPATRHSRLIDGGGGGGVAAVATVAPDYTDFRDIRGLHIVGVASRTEGVVEATAALARLAGRYGFLASASGAVAAALAKAVPYRLVPERITFIDNVRSFGSKTVLSGADLSVGH